MIPPRIAPATSPPPLPPRRWQPGPPWSQSLKSSSASRYASLARRSARSAAWAARAGSVRWRASASARFRSASARRVRRPARHPAPRVPTKSAARSTAEAAVRIDAVAAASRRWRPATSSRAAASTSSASRWASVAVLSAAAGSRAKRLRKPVPRPAHVRPRTGGSDRAPRLDSGLRCGRAGIGEVRLGLPERAEAVARPLRSRPRGGRSHRAGPSRRSRLRARDAWRSRPWPCRRPAARRCRWPRPDEPRRGPCLPRSRCLGRFATPTARTGRAR